MMKPVTAALLLLAALASGHAQQRPKVQPISDQLISLRGLPGVAVFVENPSPNMQRAGLRAADLKAGVEEGLRKGNVNVLPERAYNLDEGGAFLYVQITDLMLPRVGGYAVTLKVELYQDVRIERPAAPEVKVKAATWSSSMTMYSPPRAREHVNRYLATVVREFVDAYWHMNPKGKSF